MFARRADTRETTRRGGGHERRSTRERSRRNCPAGFSGRGVPLCPKSSGGGGSRPVGLVVLEQYVAAAPGEVEKGGVVLLALGAFAVVVGAADRVGAQGGERGQEQGPLQVLVRGAGGVLAADGGPRPAVERARPAGDRGEVPGGGNALTPPSPRCARGGRCPQPTSMRIRASVLMPTPGIEVRTPARGCASRTCSTCRAICARWSRVRASDSASLGRTASAAAMPGTTTLCSTSAVQTASAGACAPRGLALRAAAARRARPAFRSPAGPPNLATRASAAFCCTRGPSTLPREREAPPPAPGGPG